MARLFARVELRGDPSADIYQRLHSLMEDLFYYRTISGAKDGFIGPNPPVVTEQLPHGVYQGLELAGKDISVIAQAKLIKREVEQKVWSRTQVLVVKSDEWFQTAG